MSIKVSQVYPSKWVNPRDIKQPIVVSIAGVSIEEFRQRNGSMEWRIVLSFHGAKKRMILNKTQALAIAEIFGDEAEHWVTHKVQLQRGRAQNGKDTIVIKHPPTQAEDEPEAE